MILDLFIYIIQFYINQNTFLPGFIIRNETITGFIYQMYNRFPKCKPSDSYMERCKQGYRDMGWDSSILDF